MLVFVNLVSDRARQEAKAPFYGSFALPSPRASSLLQGRHVALPFQGVGFGTNSP